MLESQPKIETAGGTQQFRLRLFGENNCLKIVGIKTRGRDARQTLVSEG